LLNKFRADAAFERRVRKARAKRGDDAARELEAERPVHRLDHLIRERYPTFNDALRDLDDPLSLVHLFAALPSDQRAGVPSAAVAASKNLATEWAAWCARSGSLRKAFISVKGYYFQASVRGNTVTWLAPHALAQVLPPDVDFRVMATFLELACTSMRHVLARLYADLGSPYPPRADAALDGAAAGLEALMRGLAAAAAAAGPNNGNPAALASAPATPTLLLAGSLNGKRERRRARRAAQRAAAGGSATAENGEDEDGESSGDEDGGEEGDAAKARLAALPAKAAALAAEAGDGTISPFLLLLLLLFLLFTQLHNTSGGSDCLAFAGAVFRPVSNTHIGAPKS
jgi:pescadillo protein